jgi:hypothetical protein
MNINFNSFFYIYDKGLTQLTHLTSPKLTSINTSHMGIIVTMYILKNRPNDAPSGYR